MQRKKLKQKDDKGNVASGGRGVDPGVRADAFKNGAKCLAKALIDVSKNGIVKVDDIVDLCVDLERANGK